MEGGEEEDEPTTRERTIWKLFGKKRRGCVIFIVEINRTG